MAITHSTSKRSLKASPRGIAQHVLDTSILVEGVEAPVIRCVARKAFGKVAEGEVFFLVRSGKFPNRYYVVAWSEVSYTCSCGAGRKPHEHISKVNSYVQHAMVFVGHRHANRIAAEHFIDGDIEPHVEGDLRQAAQAQRYENLVAA